MWKNLFIISLLGCYHICNSQENNQEFDQYNWLGDRYSSEVIEWVDQQNRKSLDYLDSIKLLSYLEKWQVNFEKKYDWENMKRVPMEVNQVGQYAELIRGDTWYRMKFEKYLKNKKPDFQLNIERLGLNPEIKWEYDRVISYPSNYNKCLLLYQKKGHRDLKGVIEYDFENNGIVENGFQLPPAKTVIEWRDDQSVYISTNLANPYDEGTKIRIWTRGETLENAKVIFESTRPKVRVRLINRKDELFVIEERQAFDQSWYYLKNDKLDSLYLPTDVKDLAIVSGQLVVHLKSQWKPEEINFEESSLISIDFDSFLKGSKEFQLIAKSTKELVLDNIWSTDAILFVRGLNNVQSSLFEWTFSNGLWKSKKLQSPTGWNLSVTTTQNELNRYYIRQSDFFDYKYFLREGNGDVIAYARYYNKSINPEEYEVKQRFATSHDGTQVPYFIVYKKGLEMNGNNPVIMTGYGGHGNSILPTPLGTRWRWINDGGVFVLSNIRGGGEYGTEWHYAARKSKRQNAYDDFYAVAQDLISSGVTQERRIGIYGASNGGLLVANSFIQNPSFFGAVSINSGSIKLDDKVQLEGTNGIGATGERGDPDIPEDWAYMKKISPFHVLEKDKPYPPILLFCSRNDDVSHPSRSRKFYQRMTDLGYDNVFLIESEGGGHGYTDLANERMLELTFFYKNIHPAYEEILSEEINND